MCNLIHSERAHPGRRYSHSTRALQICTFVVFNMLVASSSSSRRSRHHHRPRSCQCWSFSRWNDGNITHWHSSRFIHPLTPNECTEIFRSLYSTSDQPRRDRCGASSIWIYAVCSPCFARLGLLLLSSRSGHYVWCCHPVEKSSSTTAILKIKSIQFKMKMSVPFGYAIS